VSTDQSGHWKRRIVFRYLDDFLNAGIDLHLTSISTRRASTASDSSSSRCWTPTAESSRAPLSEANSREIVSPLLSTAQEHSTLLSGQWVTVGVAAMNVHSARQLVLRATAVAALSPEPLQIQVSIQIICTIDLNPESLYTYMHAVHSIHNVCCTIICRSKQRWRMNTLARQQMMLSAPCQPCSRLPLGQPQATCTVGSFFQCPSGRACMLAFGNCKLALSQYTWRQLSC